MSDRTMDIGLNGDDVLPDLAAPIVDVGLSSPSLDWKKMLIEVR